MLVDLNGHTEHDNLDVLAAGPRPCRPPGWALPAPPARPSWMYVIADAMVAPEAERLFGKALSPARHVLSHRSGRQIGEAPSRAEAGLPSDGFVFCSFNRPWKITAPVFACWMRILAAVPGSVLWLKAAQSPPSAAIWRRAPRPAASIRPGWSSLRRCRWRRIWRAISLADLFLDTLPYTGHATACDALWAGLPVLTRKGATFAARVSASLLHTLGLDELVTESLEDYEALAIALAHDRPKACRIARASCRGPRSLSLVRSGAFCAEH